MMDSGFVQRHQRILVANGIAQFVAIAVVLLQPWQWHDGFMTLGPVGRDFINFWTGGHFAITGQLDILADVPNYNAWLLQKFSRDPQEWFVFSYPPHALLFLVPFGAIHHLPALLLWTALNLGLIERATRLIGGDRRLGLIACLSPAVLMMVAFGHPIGAFAYAATYIFIRGRERPVIAGILLALLTVKPQLAASLGLSLLCTGYWRTVMVSVPATLALIGVSALAFGLKPWIDFIEVTMPLHNRLVADFHFGALLVMVSVYAGARLLGLSQLVATGVQAAFSAVVMFKSMVIFNRQGPSAPTIAIALFAVVVALPYYNCYDLALFAPAMTVAMFTPEPIAERPFLPLAPALILWLAPLYAPHMGLLALPGVHVALAGIALYLVLRRGPWAPSRNARSEPVTPQSSSRVSPAVQSL